MILTKQIGSLTEISSTGGFVHKLGTDTYAPTIIMLPADTLDMYEEAAEIPAYTKEQYNDKVAELIHERYSADKEISLINNVLDANATEEHLAEYADYQAYRAECKQRAQNPELYRRNSDNEEVD